MIDREILLKSLHAGKPWHGDFLSKLSEANAIAITPADLIPALQLYLYGSLSAAEITDWASWALSDHFYVAGSDNDAIADYYEPMWYVLQQLSTPAIDGPVDLASVQSHISTLQSL